MVTFVSLFLWLMTNSHPVQVAVDPAVASVELFLDDRSIGIVDAAPWQVDCDFGPTLQPHELVAVARSADGVEIGRAVQLVNLPRADAEVQIILETGPSGSPETIRAVTESAERLRPLAVFATFDGLTLTRRTGNRFDLPAYDPKQVHIISAEAYFPEDLVARQDVTFGGTYGSRVATELTAVPVLAGESKTVRLEDVQGLLRVRETPVRVAAVERPGARVFVIRDRGAWPYLQRMGYRADQRSSGLNRRFWLDRKGNARSLSSAGLGPEHDRFHLVTPTPSFSRGLMVFPVGEPVDIERWGLPWLVTHLTNSADAINSQRLPEAVAVAGLRAAGDGCPRTVVLILSGQSFDGGGFAAEAVRDYLRALHVPLVVWTVEEGGSDGAWGRATDISDAGKLNKACRRVMQDLEGQWVVWVEGRHLPHDIALSSNPGGLRLAQ